MEKKTFVLFLIILFCAYRLPIETLFGACLILLFYEAACNHNNIRCGLFPGIQIYLYFLFSGLFIGICHIFSMRYLPRNVLKHIIYTLFPLIFWMIGKNINFDDEDEWHVCITGLFAAGVLVSLYDLLNSLIQILTGMESEISLYRFRSIIGTGHPLTLITLFLYFYMHDSIQMKKGHAHCCIGILITDLLIHFSRISFLNLLIFLLYSGAMKKTVNLLRISVLTLAGTMTLQVLFPSIFDNYVDRFRNTLTEISYSQENWDHASIVTNWRGYEVYCEIHKFQNAGAFEKLLGGGFGAQLDVNGNAYLVTTEDTLPFLHNGYFSILMIWGILGSAFFAAMLILLYTGCSGLKGKERNFWKALIVIIALDALFVHGPFFSPSAALPFLYAGILDSKRQRIPESAWKEPARRNTKWL